MPPRLSSSSTHAHCTQKSYHNLYQTEKATSATTMRASCMAILLLLCLLLLTAAPATSDAISPAAMSIVASPAPATSGSPSSQECHDQCLASKNWRFFCNVKCYHSLFEKSKKAGKIL